MSPIGPRPTQTPDRSGVPSGNRGDRAVRDRADQRRIIGATATGR